jgi:DNA-binding transcriptional MerR regulator
MGTFTIGRLAEAAGVHVETVRYYERRGLLARPARPPSGYRRYTEDHLWRLQFIARGKRLGFTLGEIAEVLGPADAGSGQSPSLVPGPVLVLAATRAKLAAIEEQQRSLERTRCRLRQLADLCQHGDEADCVALRVTG